MSRNKLEHLLHEYATLPEVSSSMSFEQQRGINTRRYKLRTESNNLIQSMGWGNCVVMYNDQAFIGYAQLMSTPYQLPVYNAADYSE